MRTGTTGVSNCSVHKELTEKELLSTWETEDEMVAMFRKYGVHSLPYGLDCFCWPGRGRT